MPPEREAKIRAKIEALDKRMAEIDALTKTKEVKGRTSQPLVGQNVSSFNFLLTSC